MISAVGHEPDVTISDYVADLRAATPSNAAELAVPDQQALLQTMDSMNTAMAAALNRQIQSGKKQLNMLAGSQGLSSPTGYIEQKKKSLDFVKNRMVSIQNQNLAGKKQRYIGAVSKLDAMSPLKVLTRGYSMVQAKDGTIVRSTSQAALGERITISLKDGKLGATVMEIQEDPV